MPRKSKDLAARAEQISAAWKRFFPDKTFSGFTLAEFVEALEPCRKVRDELKDLANRTRITRVRRRNLDASMNPVVLRVVHAVRGDPDAGENSAMYGAMGYVPKHHRRKPGRKKKQRTAGRAKAQ